MTRTALGPGPRELIVQWVGGWGDRSITRQSLPRSVRAEMGEHRQRVRTPIEETETRGFRAVMEKPSPEMSGLRWRKQRPE